MADYCGQLNVMDFILVKYWVFIWGQSGKVHRLFEKTNSTDRQTGLEEK